MGPAEREAVAGVAAHMWPGVAVSERLGRAAVLAARQVDAGEGVGREVLTRVLWLLRECGPAPSALDELRAKRACRPVLGSGWTAREG
ncbi:hypothetical protein GCM10009676_31130 [Prauserella halophila]|uniref:Uncharacterized protein n=1 Tax=Prauserella halophila TaxID=185641 RepID=A0ABN1WAU7_9PSEU|nr:hypothetical protein [Prauserella halophila]MCP2234738.1 hypothetical protein [Prauserella halophila]